MLAFGCHTCGFAPREEKANVHGDESQRACRAVWSRGISVPPSRRGCVGGTIHRRHHKARKPVDNKALMSRLPPRRLLLCASTAAKEGTVSMPAGGRGGGRGGVQRPYIDAHITRELCTVAYIVDKVVSLECSWWISCFFMACVTFRHV